MPILIHKAVSYEAASAPSLTYAWHHAETLAYF